jgi:hypothetical protein
MAAAVLVSGIVVAVVGLGPSHSKAALRVEGLQIVRPATTTTTKAPALAATAPSVTFPTSTSTSVRSTTTAPRSSAATPTTISCVMSHDRACGPFHFDPPPAPDQPLRFSVTVSPPHPTAGQTVTIHVVMDDADGPIGCVSSWSDGVMGTTNDCGTPTACDRFGAWPPPPPSAGHRAQDFTETYRTAGHYTFQIHVQPNPTPCVDARTGRGESPYQSAGSASTTITVT